jgi:hypothetical protein
MIQIKTPPTGERFLDIQRDVSRRFPRGRFVAVESASAVADAETHRELVEKLRVLGKSPQGMLIVQAGFEYPEAAVIFRLEASQRTE